jgi:hypothetical protein
MTELRIIGDSREKAAAQNREPYDLDINIVDGFGDQLTDKSDAEKQRAYVAAYTKKGTFPLAPEEGVDHAAFAGGRLPFTELVTQMQMRIGEFVGSGKFSPQITQQGEQIKIGLIDTRGRI